MNGDGKVDWLVWQYDDWTGGPQAQAARIYLNGGTFSPTWNPYPGTSTVANTANSSKACAVGDFDNDGDLDAVDAFNIYRTK